MATKRVGVSVHAGITFNLEDLGSAQSVEGAREELAQLERESDRVKNEIQQEILGISRLTIAFPRRFARRLRAAKRGRFACTRLCS